MSKTANVNVTLTVTGDGLDLGYICPQFQNTASPFEEIVTTLNTGDNTFTAPSGAKGFLLMPPPTNTTAIKLKGGAGDTGILLAATGQPPIPLDPGQASIILNVGQSVASVTLVWF